MQGNSVPMDDIYSLSEEDIKLRYITPAILNKGWSVTDITMETQVKLTDGKINLRGNLMAKIKFIEPQQEDLLYNDVCQIIDGARSRIATYVI